MTGECSVCGNRVRVVTPAGGDGSAVVAYRHKVDGVRCQGGRLEVDWETVEEA